MISLGYNIFTGNEFYLPDSNEGNTIIAAQAGYGKSIILKMIAIQEAKKKYVLIIDFKGEHVDIKFARYRSSFSGSIPGLQIIHNPVFKISDFKNPRNWSGFQFPLGAQNKAAQLARDISQHGDDPATFRERIEQLDTSGYSKESTFEASKRSMASKFREDVFFNPAEPQDDKTYIPDYGAFLREYRHILVNLNLDLVSDTGVAQTATAMVLEQIGRLIPRQALRNLAVFIEEADTLVPADYEITPYSLELIAKYSRKLQKEGVRIFYCTQSIRNIHPSIRENVHDYILGHLNHGDYYAEWTKSLVRDRVKDGMIQFLWTDGKRKKVVFKPHECPVQFDERF